MLLRLAGERRGARRAPARPARGARGRTTPRRARRARRQPARHGRRGPVEVAHEALLREWPRLRGWLEDDAEGRRLHQHLIEAARDWAGRGRDPGELYRGARLAAALDWAAAPRARAQRARARVPGRASRAAPSARASASAAPTGGCAAGRRARRRARASRSRAGAVALHQRGEARDAAVVADAERLGAEALDEDRLDRALLLARQGVALDDSPATRGNLLSVLVRSPAALGVIDTAAPVRRGDQPRRAALASATRAAT